MASSDQEYSVEQEIVAFFDKTSTTRTACNLRAKELVGGDVVSVPIQGVCSYTVYAGPQADSVVQFRLKSLCMPLTIVQEAHRVYGSLAPEVHFKGQIGEDEAGKEALYVYVMPRLKGISRLDFILSYGFPEDAAEVRAKRLTLVTDAARFFALSWKSPLPVTAATRDDLHLSYQRDLQLLLRTLPQRFHFSIRSCLEALPAIMRLPMVLTHKDFGDSNILVDAATCHLVGVIDWAEARTEPFGINLYSVENLMGKFHLRHGYIRYLDYDTLQKAFWSTLKEEVGGWSDETFNTIQLAMALGLLLSRGFTSRLANMPEPSPISDDQSGAYNMLRLDSWLVNPNTKFI